MTPTPSQDIQYSEISTPGYSEISTEMLRNIKMIKMIE